MYHIRIQLILRIKMSTNIFQKMIYFLLIRDNDAWQAFLVYWRSYEPMAFEECGEPNQKHKYRADELFIVLIFFFTSRGEKCSLFDQNRWDIKEVTTKSDFSCEPWEFVGRGACGFAAMQLYHESHYMT